MLVDEQHNLFIVADGLGGHNAGEVASSLAVTEIANLIRKGLTDKRDPESLIAHSVLAAHETILEKSLETPQWGDMATTAVVALRAGDHFLICHVGDSRAYMIGNGTISRLTTDHSFVAEWLEAGRITPEEARTHAARHGITMALGVDDIVEPVVACLPWDTDGCLILCSDGLTDMVEDDAILEIVESSKDPQDACGNLIARANENGGRDNITVVIVCPD